MRRLHHPSPLASFLFLLLTSPHRIAAEPNRNEWPYNLPANVKYYPELERLARRNLDAHARLRDDPAPTAVRKMSDDEGEMFFLDYWQFGPRADEQWDADLALGTGLPDPRDANAAVSRRPEEHDRGLSNLTDSSLLQPFLLHSNFTQQGSRWSIWGRSLSKRDFECPAGTESCASIGRPNSCCGTGETCVQVADTGLGDVGCCARGSFCGGSLSPCNTAAGYQSCPNSPNGGCCIPNFACLDVGCIASSTMTTTITLTPSTTTLRPSTISSPSSQPPPTCNPGFQSCPPSLGGGCCPSSRACGPTDCPPLSTAVPPVRPTGSTTLPPLPLPTTTAAAPPDGCPGGFYMCSAYYIGGCCRVGRDCKETNCPRPASTTTVDEHGATIVVPVGEVTATATAGSCAVGWYRCPAEANGGCCPEGYGCGTGAECTAMAEGGGRVGKSPLSRGSVVRGDVGAVWVAVGAVAWLLAL